MPVHFSRDVRQYFDKVFPNRWIRRAVPITWTSRSPDLSSLNFFLWEYVKDNIYKSVSCNLGELKIKIADEIENI